MSPSLRGRVSAPPLCTQRVTLGGPSRLFSLPCIRLRETSRMLAPVPSFLSAGGPTGAARPRHWHVLQIAVAAADGLSAQETSPQHVSRGGSMGWQAWPWSLCLPVAIPWGWPHLVHAANHARALCPCSTAQGGATWPQREAPLCSLIGWFQSRDGPGPMTSLGSPFLDCFRPRWSALRQQCQGLGATSGPRAEGRLLWEPGPLRGPNCRCAHVAGFLPGWL